MFIVALAITIMAGLAYWADARGRDPAAVPVHVHHRHEGSGQESGGSERFE